ncbi:MAG TPA: SH3 domain-containing protein [Candidatus Acidoferrales bacterium]|nr:SH3 domain-containing protein [Candidatus Acidoferrales bacterium]
MAQIGVLLRRLSAGALAGFLATAWQGNSLPDARLSLFRPSGALAAEKTTPYVTTIDVNLRSGPGLEYDVVTTIKSGTRINVAGHEGEWLKVVSKQGNPPGYILDRFARPLEEPPKTSAAALGTYVTTAEVNVRSGPGTQYSIVSRIPKDTRVEVVDAEGDWLKVQSKHGKPSGYVSARYLRRFSPP